MDIPEKIYLYRIVHWKNIAHILQYGLCCKSHANKNPTYINIGHKQLIADRTDTKIPLKNAGTLGEYIPFYFGGHSPMLFLIKNGYQGVEKRAQEDIAYLVTTFKKIKKAGLEFVFADRNAKLTLANFYTKKKDLDKVKWGIVKSKYWKSDEDNLARQDYKQAEFLVKNHIPIDNIIALVVKTKERKRYFKTLIEKLGLEINIHVDSKNQLYY